METPALRWWRLLLRACKSPGQTTFRNMPLRGLSEIRLQQFAKKRRSAAVLDDCVSLVQTRCVKFGGDVRRELRVSSDSLYDGVGDAVDVEW